MPLCAIGNAILEVLGLNPSTFDYASDANWPSQAVFDEEPYYQPTGLGARAMTIALAARPHVMGGLEQFEALKRHHEAQDVVPYIRLTGVAIGGFFQIGRVGGDVAVQHISQSEKRLAPDGLGYRHEFEAKLLFVGRRAGGFQ